MARPLPPLLLMARPLVEDFFFLAASLPYIYLLHSQKMLIAKKPYFLCYHFGFKILKTKQMLRSGFVNKSVLLILSLSSTVYPEL